jgi:hypothetical protein
LVQEAQQARQGRDFLRDDVVDEIERVEQDLRDRCQALPGALAEQGAALQAAFDDWESQVDELQEYVTAQAFQASHQHAKDVVEYAFDECRTSYGQQLDAFGQLLDALSAELDGLGQVVQRSCDAVVAQAGAELTSSLEATRDAAQKALTALDGVRDLLASYSFVEVEPC